MAKNISNVSVHIGSSPRNAEVPISIAVWNLVGVARILDKAS